jgi:hypothetical protein
MVINFFETFFFIKKKNLDFYPIAIDNIIFSLRFYKNLVHVFLLIKKKKKKKNLVHVLLHLKE